MSSPVSDPFERARIAEQVSREPTEESLDTIRTTVLRNHDQLNDINNRLSRIEQSIHNLHSMVRIVMNAGLRTETSSSGSEIKVIKRK